MSKDTPEALGTMEENDSPEETTESRLATFLARFALYWRLSERSSILTACYYGTDERKKDAVIDALTQKYGPAVVHSKGTVTEEWKTAKILILEIDWEHAGGQFNIARPMFAPPWRPEGSITVILDHDSESFSKNARDLYDWVSHRDFI